MPKTKREVTEIFTQLEVLAPLGVDVKLVDYSDLPIRLTIIEPRDQTSILLQMNAHALLYMLVGLIADLAELTGKAAGQQKVDVN